LVFYNCIKTAIYLIIHKVTKLDILKSSHTFSMPSIPLLLLAMLAYFLISLFMHCDFMVVTGTQSVVFLLGVVKINASFGALKYEHGTRVLLAQEFTSRISNKI